MSFKRLDPSDIILSVENISTPIWSDNYFDLFGKDGNETIFLDNNQRASESGKYFLQVHKGGFPPPVEFTISYGNKLGSGSVLYSEGADGSYSKSIYGQYKNLILGGLYDSFNFIPSGSTDNDHLFAINIERANYKEKILLGSLSLTLSNGANIITLTDDSKYTTTVSYTEAGRKYNLVSGSVGESEDLETTYGWLLPDIGVILLNPDTIKDSLPDGDLYTDSSSYDNSEFANGDLNSIKLFNSISSGSSFILNSEETLSSIYTFVRARNNEFNYTENPSFIDEDGDILYPDFIYNPKTYITTVGFYNDRNELLAVAKLSRPLPKDFTKELLIRSKLSY